MQPLDRLILETWNRLKPQILADPEELARRLRRRDSRTFSRPPRAWCLAVRACDRRIGVRNGQIDPEYATDPRDPDHPGHVVEHTVTLSAELLRELCCPVTLTAGGELCDDAARKLGVARSAINSARITGALETRHVKGLLGRRGPPVPIVSTSHLLDACAGRDFRIAHPLWVGHEYVSARVPDDLSQTIKRVPVYESTRSARQFDPEAHPEHAEPPPRRDRPRLPPPKPDYVWYKWSKSGEFLGEDPLYWRKSFDDPGSPQPPQPEKPKREYKSRPSQSSGSLVFRGWRWICPKCSQKVRTLYLPAPPANLIELPETSKSEARSTKQIQYSNAENPKPASELSDLDHSNLFRISSFDIRASRSAGFACFTCHRIRGFSPAAPNGWNDIVSALSGCLLRGSDIPKPAWFTENAYRRNKYHPRLRAAPRSELLRELVLQGHSAKKIAAKMGICVTNAESRISLLCKKENVPNRAELARKLGLDPSIQPDRYGKARARRQRVLDLLLKGFSTPEIAAQLGRNCKAVHEDVYVLCQNHRVKGRAALIAKCRSREELDLVLKSQSRIKSVIAPN